MSTTDVSGIRSGGRLEAERKDKSHDLSLDSAANSNRAISDSIQFSEAAQHLAALKQELASIDSVDIAKVEKIKQAISNGMYSVDTQKIAESLISLENDLDRK
jgi:negative regulator of flagellin synthesis FlgM